MVEAQVAEIMSMIVGAYSVHMNVGQSKLVNKSTAIVSLEKSMSNTFSNKAIQLFGNARIQLPSAINFNNSDNVSVLISVILFLMSRGKRRYSSTPYSTGTPLYSTRTPLILHCTPLVLHWYSTLLHSYSTDTPLYSTRTPLILHSTPLVLHWYSTRTPLYSTDTSLVLHSTPPILHPYSTCTPPILHPTQRAKSETPVLPSHYPLTPSYLSILLLIVREGCNGDDNPNYGYWSTMITAFYRHFTKKRIFWENNEIS